MRGGAEIARSFKHVPSEVGAHEAEEVGVEHLLRDINDPAVSVLAGDIKAKVTGLRGLSSRLVQVGDYLDKVTSGKLPVNNEVLYELQVRREGGRAATTAQRPPPPPPFFPS